MLTKEQFDAKVKAGEPIEIGEFPDDVELNFNNLNSLISANLEKNNKANIDAVLAELKKSNAAEIFGTGEGDTKVGKCVVDTSVFSKRYNRPKVYGDAKVDGDLLGKQFLNDGGPFLSISPEMETFAKMCKCGFKADRMITEGIDIKKHKEQVAAGYKATGMSEGTAADGGNLVPVEYASTVIEFAVRQSPLLSMVTRQPMKSNVLKIPRLAQSAGSYFGNVSLYWIDEAADKTPTKPAFEQLTFTAEKLIGLVVMTDELIADSMINVINYVTGLMVRAIQYEWERVVLMGTGVGQPLGVVYDPTINIVNRQNEGTISYIDLLNMEAALDENFINLDWVTRRTTSTTLRNLRDNQNALLFSETWNGLAGDITMQPRLHGFPVHYTRNVPSIGNKGDIVLGEWQYYILAVRQDITIDQSIHAYFVSDETAIRFVCRLDGMPGVPEAFAILDEMRS